MKRIFLSLALILGILSPLALSACGNPYEGMTVSVNVEDTVVIDLSSEENFAYVDAIVSGCEELCACTFNEFSNAITITEQYLGNGVTRAKIVADAECDETTVTVITNENSMTTQFKVKVIKALDKIELKNTAITYKMITNKDATDVQEIVLSSDMFTDDSEKHVEFKLANEYPGIEITENVLKVTGVINSPKTINIQANSLRKADVITTFEYLLLPSIKGEVNGTDEPIVLVRNNEAKNHATVSLDLTNVENYEIEPSVIVVGDTVEVSSSRTHVEADVTNFTVELSGSNIGKSTLRFYAQYKNYPEIQIEVHSIEVTTKDEITGINYYLSENGDYRDLNDVDIYSNYGQGLLGQKIFFEPYPNPSKSLTVVDEMMLKIELDDDARENFIIYDSLGNIIDESAFEIITEDFIYVRALNNDAKNGIITVSSKANNISRKITLVAKTGVQSFEFKIGETNVENIYLSTNEEVSQEVQIVTQPENSDLRNVMLTTTGTGFTATLNEETIKITSIVGTQDQIGTVTVTFPNMTKKVLTVETFKSMVDADLKVTSSSPFESNSVGYYELEDNGNLENIVVKNNSIIPIKIDSNGAEIIKVESKPSEYVNVYSIGKEYFLSTLNAGIEVVNLTIYGYEMKDGQKVETSFTREFKIEVYNPLSTLELDKYELNLYAYDTLGYYDKSFSTDSVEAYINRDGIAPTKVEVEWQFAPALKAYLEHKDISENNEDYKKYQFTANTYDSNTEAKTLILTATEYFDSVSKYGKVLSVALKVYIRKAVKVEKIELRNIGKNGIYIDLTKTNELTYPILTNVISPDKGEALNTALKYEFIPNAGTATDLVTISSDGVVHFSADKIGGSGTIRITPFDRYIEVDGEIVATDLENVSLLIPIYIADGKSKNSAINISSILEVTNRDWHYRLITNTSLTEDFDFRNFNGGLYGALNGDENVRATISLNTHTLFDTLTENAIVENIILTGSTSSNGFVAKVNKGKINNVLVDGYMKDFKFIPSAIQSTNDYVGGIVGENRGEITNCTFAGSITGEGKYVGGIAGINYGTIDSSTVEILAYEKADGTDGHERNKFEGINVAGLVGVNNGDLSNSYVYDYFDNVKKFELVNDEKGTSTNCDYEFKSSEDAKDYKIKQTLLSLPEVEGKAVLFFYQPDETGLTSEEVVFFKRINTVTFEDLFGITDDSDVRVISSDSKVKVASNSLTVNGVGELQLKIFSKYNIQSARIINVLVCYEMNDFGASTNGVALTEYSTVKVKRGNVVTFKTGIEDNIIAVNRPIKLKTQSGVTVDVKFYNAKNEEISGIEVKGKNLGVHSFVVDKKFEGYDKFDVKYNASIKNDSYKNIISKYIAGKFAVSTYKGAENLTVSVNKIQMQPSRSQTFEVTFISDDPTDELKCTVYDVLGDENEYFIIDSVLEKESIGDTGYFNYKYTLTVSFDLKNINKSNEELYEHNFSLKIIPSSLTPVSSPIVVEIDLVPQELINISATHHVPKDAELVNDYIIFDYRANNGLTPGTFGLLNVSLFPNYSSFDYINITSSVVDNHKISFRLMKKDAEGKFYDANINTFSKIDNGIRLERSVLADSYFDKNNHMGILYIKTMVSADVDVDANFQILVQPYYNDEPTEKNLVFDIQTKYLDEATIMVNDKYNETYVAEYCDAEVKVIVPLDQSFSTSNVSIKSANDDYTLSSWKEEIDYRKNIAIYTATLTVGNAEKYEINASINWLVNGKYEVKQTTFTIHTVPFTISNDGTQLKVDYENKTVFNANIDIKKELDFVFNATFDKEKNAEAYNEFEINNYFNDKEYIVNRLDEGLINDGQVNWINNLYYVNGNELASVKDHTNNYVEFKYNKEFNRLFVIGKATGNVAMRFRMQIVYPNGTSTNIEFDFTIRVTVYTDEDLPRVIKSATDLLNIQYEEEEHDYILIDNIELNDYTPIDTDKIRSLDGNNKSIIIRNFAEPAENQTTVNYSLFNTVKSGTLLKNLTVNYHYLNSVVVDTSVIKEVNVAGLAITNQGIIYNCEVVAFKEDSVQSLLANNGLNFRYSSGSIYQSVSSTVAGFVIDNQTNASITNSRVGGQSITKVLDDEGLTHTVKLNPFVISAQGNIAGFVYNNSGNISSSFFDNAYILNNSTSDYSTITAGFVANNNAGQIVMSYARGVYNNSIEVHATRYGITSTGISAGFVYNNKAKISDCYTNIRLVNNNTAGRASAGFVYMNGENGVIEKSYSASQIMFNTTTQMNFSGVDENQEFLNAGKIENCYYYDQNVELHTQNTVNAPAVEEYYGSPAIRVSVISNIESYYGFAFTTTDENDGVWKITVRGPELIEANNIAISARIHKEKENSELYTLNYVDGYDYGSSNNPIIIRDSKEFNEVFGNSSRTVIQNYYNKTTGSVFGNYRLVNNIDFSNFSRDTVLNSSRMKLTQVQDIIGRATGRGTLEGNGLSITNISLSASDDIKDSFGLFKSIENGAIVKNLNIVLGKADEKGNVYGISAGNVSSVGTLAGMVIDSTLANINISSLKTQNQVKVEGQNLVGGVAGKVAGLSKANSISIDNISVKALQTAVVEYARKANAVRYSYAGGLFAVVDIYKSIEAGPIVFGDKESSSSILKLSVTGNGSIEGAIVGGAIGYVGQSTHVQDVKYELGTSNSQKLIAYTGGYAGGVVGLNEGILNQVRAEHYASLQKEIEDSIETYYDEDKYDADKEVNRGNEYLFESEDYSPKYIGGIVGYQMGGEIFRSYSKIHVKSEKAEYAGGMVGYSKDVLNATECYTTSDVYARMYIGGIIGKGEKINFHLVNALNYWDRELLVKKNYVYNDDKIVTGNIGVISYDVVLNPVASDENENISKIYLLTQVNFVNPLDKTKFIEDIHIQISYYNVNNLKNNKGVNCDISDEVDTTFTYSEDRDVCLDKANYLFAISENNWSINKWERQSDELYPSMKFIVTSEVYYINVASDIELMNLYPNATFVITGMINCESYQRKSFRVSYFSGTLKGKNETDDWGFRNLDLENPLFTNAYNATFLNFTWENCPQLIDNARGITMVNVTFKDCEVTKESGTIAENTSIAINKIVGGKNEIEAVSFSNSQIILGKSEPVTTSTDEIVANIGLLFGSATASRLTLKNINVESINVESSSGIVYYGSAVANIGLLGGSVAGSVTINYESAFKTQGNITAEIEDKSSDKYATVGMLGVVTDELTIQGLNMSNVKFNVKSNTNVNASLVVGQTANLTLDSAKIATDKTSALSTLTVKPTGTDEKIYNVGGLAGKLTGDANFIKSSTLGKKLEVKIDSSDEAKDNDIYAGGVVGLYECKAGDSWKGKTADDQLGLLCYNKLTITGSSGTNKNNIYAGGILGNIQQNGPDVAGADYITVSENFWYGSINLNNLSTKDTVYVGGIIGSATASNLKVEYNYSAGYCEITYKDGAGSNEGMVGIGGIIGYSKDCIPTNNYSLFTLFNMSGRYYFEESYFANAIVGAFETSVTFKEKVLDKDGNLVSFYGNEYSSSVCLLSDNELLADNVAYTTLSGEFRKFYNDSDEVYGKKLNPHTGKDFATIEENAEFEYDNRNSLDYYYYEKKYDEDKVEVAYESDGGLSIGDGNFVAFNRSKAISTGSLNLFNTIGYGSVVSGLYYQVDTKTNEMGAEIGVFATKNNGIIFGCSTTKIDIKNSIHYQNANISSFVYTNNGFITQSFSDLEIDTHKNGYGFVAEGNNGYTDSCYSSGIVNANQNAFAFGNNNSVNCYTITQVGRDQNKADTFTFSGKAKDCFYEKTSVQHYESGDDMIIGINEISLNYAESDVESNKEKVETTIKENFKDSNMSVWTIDKDYNYGFPILINTDYKAEINKTTLIEGDKSTYYINSLGKLEQIASKLDGNYVIARDLYGGFENLSAGGYKFDIINGAFTGTLTGSKTETRYNYDIKDGQTVQGGAVKVITDAITISCINLHQGGIFEEIGEEINGKNASVTEIKFKDFHVISDDSILGSAGVVAKTLTQGTISNITLLGGNPNPNKSKPGAKAVKPTLDSPNANINRVTVFGGIVGTMKGGTVENIHQNAYILSKQDEAFNTDTEIIFGGVVGEIIISETVSTESETVSKCFNTGIVENTPQNDAPLGMTYITGGIVGKITGTAEISECMNKHIDNTSQDFQTDKAMGVYSGNETCDKSYAGGIVGCASDSSEISYCYNAGMVKADAEEKKSHNITLSGEDYWETSHRKGEAKYALFKKEAYAGGISGYGGKIKDSYNTVLGGKTETKFDNIYSVEGGYEIFKPYYLHVWHELAFWLKVVYGAIAIAVAFAVGIATWATGGGALAIFFSCLGSGALTIVGNMIPNQIHMSILVDYFDKQDISPNFSGDTWGEEINYRDKQHDLKSFGTLLYIDFYDDALKKAKLSNKYTKFFNGIGNNAERSSCEVIQNSVSTTKPKEIYNTKYPVYFNKLDRYLNLEDFGITVDSTKRSLTDKTKESLIWEVYTGIHQELKAFSDFESKTTNIVYKENSEGRRVYEINSVTELNKIKAIYEVATNNIGKVDAAEHETLAYYEDAVFVLTADIDITVSNWTPIKNFNATFDGNGHEIRGVKITSSDENVGLFANTQNATIKNLKITGMEIRATSGNSTYVGGLVGYAKDTEILNCEVAVNITTADAGYTAFIAGFMEGGRIEGEIIVSPDGKEADYQFVTANGSIIAYSKDKDINVAGITAGVKNYTIEIEGTKKEEEPKFAYLKVDHNSAITAKAVGNSGEISAKAINVYRFAPGVDHEQDPDCYKSFTEIDCGSYLEYSMNRKVLNSEYVIKTKNATIDGTTAATNEQTWSQLKDDYDNDISFTITNKLPSLVGYNRETHATQTIYTSGDLTRVVYDISYYQYKISTYYYNLDGLTAGSADNALTVLNNYYAQHSDKFRFEIDVRKSQFNIELIYKDSSSEFDMVVSDATDELFVMYLKGDTDIKKLLLRDGSDGQFTNFSSDIDLGKILTFKDDFCTESSLMGESIFVIDDDDINPKVTGFNESIFENKVDVESNSDHAFKSKYIKSTDLDMEPYEISLPENEIFYSSIITEMIYDSDIVINEGKTGDHIGKYRYTENPISLVVTKDGNSISLGFEIDYDYEIDDYYITPKTDESGNPIEKVKVESTDNGDLSAKNFIKESYGEDMDASNVIFFEHKILVDYATDYFDASKGIAVKYDTKNDKYIRYNFEANAVGQVTKHISKETYKLTEVKDHYFATDYSIEYYDDSNPYTVNFEIKNVKSTDEITLPYVYEDGGVLKEDLSETITFKYEKSAVTTLDEDSYSERTDAFECQFTLDGENYYPTSQLKSHDKWKNYSVKDSGIYITTDSKVRVYDWNGTYKNYDK